MGYYHDYGHIHGALNHHIMLNNILHKRRLDKTGRLVSNARPSVE